MLSSCVWRQVVSINITNPQILRYEKSADSVFHVRGSERYRAVAHARGGAQCRDDGGDDAADDLEDGFPRFLFHGVKWFLSGLINFSSLSLYRGGRWSVSLPPRLV